jgi:endonuclease-3 related protein
MRKARLIPELLLKLERRYGKQQPGWPVDPYEFIIWWHCGYPASDTACQKGWSKLQREVGVEPHKLLEAAPDKIAAALKPGGMFPELRALQLKEVAMQVENAFGGDLRAGLRGPVPQARKALKSFPGIADAGADRILLFAAIAPIAAIPSNCVHVLVRILKGPERGSYSANYRDASQAIAAAVPETFEARARAYLLLKRHGQETCKRTKPKCDECPVCSYCVFAAGNRSPR